jgi:hypothetical protein
MTETVDLAQRHAHHYLFSATSEETIKMPQTKFLLDESEIPTHWYNVVADMPTRRPRRSARTASRLARKR